MTDDAAFGRKVGLFLPRDEADRRTRINYLSSIVVYRCLQRWNFDINWRITADEGRQPERWRGAPPALSPSAQLHRASCEDLGRLRRRGPA